MPGTPRAQGAPPEPYFVSVKEAARRLSVTPWQVYRLCDSNELKSRYLGKRRLVDAESLREFASSLPETRGA